MHDGVVVFLRQRRIVDLYAPLRWPLHYSEYVRLNYDCAITGERELSVGSRCCDWHSARAELGYRKVYTAATEAAQAMVINYNATIVACRRVCGDGLDAARDT